MEASLFMLLPTGVEVLELELTEDALKQMMSPLMTVKDFARQNGIDLRIYFDGDNIKQFMQDVGGIIENGHYLDKPSTIIRNFVSSCSTDVRNTVLLDGSCSYIRWDTVSCGIDANAPEVVKSAYESPSAPCVLSLAQGVPTDYYLVSLIKDRQYQGNLPELKNIPLFFSVCECIEWLSSLTDGHFSLTGNREFERTHYKWGHQTMFRKIADSSYWYFDYFHKDNKIHYEVFNEDGDHLGEASADGVLLPGTADNKKSISDILHGK